jgi:hypothetical protein
MAYHVLHRGCRNGLFGRGAGSGAASQPSLDRSLHGDVLVLYTDGAVEAENQAGEQYSATRLAKIASMYSQQSADELVGTIYRSITEFRGTKLTILRWSC